MTPRTTVSALAAGLLVCLAPTLKADIIGNFEDLTFNSPSTPGSVGGSMTVDLSGLAGGTTGTIVYNLTGLDVTADGTANDTASFTINVSAADGTISTPTFTGSGQVNIGIDSTVNGSNNLSGPLEILTFSYGSGSVVLGDGGTGAAIDFKGFRNVGLASFSDADAGVAGSGETAIISGGTAVDGTYSDGDASAFDTSANTFGNVSSFTVGAGDAADRFSVKGLGARIGFEGTPIPEPASGLLALGGLLCLGARRRRTA